MYIIVYDLNLFAAKHFSSVYSSKLVDYDLINLNIPFFDPPNNCYFPQRMFFLN